MTSTGYLFIDNRVSGGGVTELDTLTCSHCKVVYVMNKERTRERGFCVKCCAYICDLCVAATRTPDYNHLPFEKLVDLVKDDKVLIIGGSPSNPNLLKLRR